MLPVLQARRLPTRRASARRAHAGDVTSERRQHVLAFLRQRSHDASINSKQNRTLAAVFADPASAGIEWAAIESLLLAADCTLIEGRGSRVRFVCREVVASFHRPHPAKDAKRYQVRDARAFLLKIGVRP